MWSKKFPISEKVYFDQLLDFPTCVYCKTASLENYANTVQARGLISWAICITDVIDLVYCIKSLTIG